MNKTVRKWVLILAMGMLYASLYLLPYIRYVFYDALVAASGFTNTQLGMTMTLAMTCGFILTPFSGWLADRFKLKTQMLAAGIIHVVITFVYPSVITSFPLTMLIWALTSITGVLFFWSQVFKMVRLVGARDNTGTRTFGIFEGSIGIWSMTFSMIALAVYASMEAADNVAALKAAIYFYGFMTLLGTILVFFFYDKSYEEGRTETGEAEVKTKATTREILAVFKTLDVWILSLAIFAIYGFFVGSSYFTPYFSTVLGVSIVFSGGWASFRTYGTRAIGAPVGGVVSGKVGTLNFQIVAFLIVVAFMAVFMFLPANEGIIVPVTVLMILMAFVNNGQRGSMWAIMDDLKIPANLSGIAIAVASLIGITMPDVVMPLIFGVWLDNYEPVAAYRMIFGFLFGVLILGLLSLTLIKVRIKRRAALPATASNAGTGA